MKYLLLILLFLFSKNVATAQKMPSDYFDEADKFYESKEFDKALTAYQYIVDHHPKNELYPRALYNTGYLYFDQKRFEKAIPVFKAILSGNFNEHENSGGSIMADPYTNYRHRAGLVLSDIYCEKENYDSALYYFTLSDSTNPYLHFCGNELAANNVYKALRYADIYQKLNQPNKAIGKLLPAVFIELSDNTDVITELRKLIKSKTGLKNELDESLNKMYSREMKQGKRTYSWYYFRFLDTEIIVPGSYETNGKKEFDKQEAIKKIGETNFYKMIMKL